MAISNSTTLPPPTTKLLEPTLDRQAVHLEEFAMAAISVGDEPLDRASAQLREDWPKWLAAEEQEWRELVQAETWTWVPTSEPADANKKIISSKFAYKQKPDRAKARLCARGFLQNPDEVGNKYAPVCRPEVLRIMFALAQRCRWSIRAFDIRNAYVQAPVTRPVYVDPPDGYKRPGHCMRLNKALYGLPGSGRAWYKCFDRFMRSQHFKPSSVDPCLYIHTSKRVFVCTYVDDCCIIGDPAYVFGFLDIYL